MKNFSWGTTPSPRIQVQPTLHPPCQNYKSQLDINLKSFLKLRKIFQRFPSCRICPNAKSENTENSEISEINLTLLFCSETVKKKHVNSCHNYKSQLDINLLLYLLALKQSRNARKQWQPFQITVTYKIQIISETEKNLSEFSNFA